jgi:hypothetical protein
MSLAKIFAGTSFAFSHPIFHFSITPLFHGLANSKSEVAGVKSKQRLLGQDA